MHTVFVIMMHTSLPLQLAILLQKQALLLQSENLKTMFSMRRQVVGICMVLEQSLVEVCLEGLNGVSMCPVVWEWCMNACEKSVRGLWG